MSNQNNATNAGNFSSLVISIVDDIEAGKGGPLAIIKAQENDAFMLADRVNHALETESMSERKVVLDFFAAQPEGEKLLEQAAALKGKGLTRNQKDKRTMLQARIRSVESLLIRTVKVANVIRNLENHAFDVTIRKPYAGSKTLVAYVAGPDDDTADAVMMSVNALMAMDGVNLANIRKVGDVPTSAGKRKDAPNANGSSANGEAIAPAKLGDVLNSVDTTLAKFDLSKKDNGLPPGAVAWALRLYAHLETVLTDEQKKAALASYGEDDEDRASMYVRSK